MLSVPGSSSNVLCRVVALLLLPLLLFGCGGGADYSAEPGELAERYLPTERAVNHHPDSLGALTITEEEGKIRYQLERSYKSLVEKWSSTFQVGGTGRTPLRTFSYATFWSLELSLAALQPEMGILTIRKERAQELIEERRKGYFNTIQIDVHWFVREGGDGIVAGPGFRTELRVRDSTSRPIRDDYGPLREAYIDAADQALYRRNTLHFPRIVDGRDILRNASEMRLEIREAGSSATAQFAWSWEGSQAVRREGTEGFSSTTATHRSRR